MNQAGRFAFTDNYETVSELATLAWENERSIVNLAFLAAFQNQHTACTFKFVSFAIA